MYNQFLYYSLNTRIQGFYFFVNSIKDKRIPQSLTLILYSAEF